MPKKWSYVIIIFMLLLFMFITNFTVSVSRACIMGILIIFSKLVYRKSDFITNISLSSLITLSVNPFVINDIGFGLSYLGTIGIVFLNKNYKEIFVKIKIKEKIAKALSVVFSAQTLIIPIMMLKFNSISFTFFISNLLVSPILAIIIILGFITIIISYIYFNIAKILAIILNICLELLLQISSFISKIPFSSVLIKTPYEFFIIFIYIFIIFVHYLYRLHLNKENKRLYKRKIIKIIKNLNYKKIVIVIFISIILLNISINVHQIIFPKLKINFVDVGQGDACLIITPKNKKILIDGGEGKTDVLLQYLLDRRINNIDYIIISHFDSDHIGGLFEVIEKLKIGQIFISNQEESENYERLTNIVRERKINATIINTSNNSAQRFKIENDLNIDFLWPSNSKLINENSLNNNSIVCKLNYKDCSILFTGDIEETAEDAILNEYKGDLNRLNATILKIAHHGSNTSSTEKFINAVKPKIALIGVGNNNKFGHPNGEVIMRLQNIRKQDISYR